MPNGLKSFLWAVVAGLVMSAALIGYSRFSLPPAAPAVFAPAVEAAPAAPEVATVIKSGTVKIKQGAAATLKLPVGPREGVLEASRIGASEHAQTVATVIDTDSGETRQVVREEPLPWFAIDKHGGLGMYYGLSAGQPAVMLQVRQALLSVKAVHVQAIGQVVQPIGGVADYFVGVGAEYRW